jgi:isoleucyl-tRNA synthetase
MAPLLPLTTEEVWRGLTGGRSVHLTDWPDAADFPADDDLVAAMDRAREVCSTGSALRKSEGLRVRLPLASLTVVADDPTSLQPFVDLIADELNVKQVDLVDVAAAGDAAFGVRQSLQVNARAAGPRLGRDVQNAIKASKSGNWAVADDGSVVAGGIPLREGEYTLQTLVAEDAGGRQRAVGMLSGGGFLILDTAVTPELAAEGTARDLVRSVQQQRREDDLDVSDRIRLALSGPPETVAAARAHQELIKAETLAETLELAESSELSISLQRI